MNLDSEELKRSLLIMLLHSGKLIKYNCLLMEAESITIDVPHIPIIYKWRVLAERDESRVR